MLRLMTHNVWNYDNNSPAWEKIGEDCSALVRSKGFVRVYKETLPDIIGGQEYSALMTDLVKKGCAADGLNYSLVEGRFTPIFFRADKLELLDNEFATYPDYIEGFDGKFNDAFTKSWNLAVFREIKSKKIFIFVTTHLWWKSSDLKIKETKPKNYQAYSDEAREYQISLLNKKINQYYDKYQCPIVLVGDFNTGYNSKAVKLLFDNGFHHAHDIATDFADETSGRHDCYAWGYTKEYRNTPFESAIDHILLKGEPEGSVKEFKRYSPEYYYPLSDHSPTFIDIEL